MTCQQFNNIMQAFGLQQHIDQSTDDHGDILDVVITRVDQPLADITMNDVGFSDHRIIQFTTR